MRGRLPEPRLGHERYRWLEALRHTPAGAVRVGVLSDVGAMDMTELEGLGRVLLVVGLVLALLGVVLLVAGRVPLLGRLPGDLRFEWGSVRVYIPLATSLLLSVVLTLLLTLIARLRD